MTDVNAANADFWNEPCGTLLARSIGINEFTPASLARFDETYLSFYPYLRPIIDRAGFVGADVLEIGLGYGTVGQYLAEGAKSYRGIDIAEEPVGLLELRLQAIGRTGTAHAQQGNALALPFEDASFDVVVSIGTLHHTGDLARALGEVRRVLRPGGRAVVMVYNGWSFRRLAHLARTGLRRLIARRASDADRDLRKAFDANTAGEAAPHTDFVSVRGARRLLAGFSTSRTELRNFDDYVVLRRVVPRRWFMGSVDRVLGLDLYITAVR